MFWHEKYYSPTLDREVEYDEFKEFSCEKLNSLLDLDTEAFEHMVEKDPCEVRKKLTMGYFTYGNWLIAHDLDLYKCAMEHRIKPLSDLRRKAYQLTQKKKFEFEYTINSEVPIPIEKVVEGRNYVPIKNDANKLAGIKIKNVISDDIINVKNLGERKLNQFLGYLSLYSHELSIKVGQWNASYTDVCGESMMMIGTEKVTAKQIGWDNLPPLRLDSIDDLEFDGGIVLDLLYVATLSESQEMWRGAFLNLYLALEYLLEHKQIDGREFKKYKWIRHSMAHSKLDPEKFSEKGFQFLEKEFGSRMPDWGDLEVLVKLGNWTRYLKAEVRKIVIVEVK